ncbi:hypothetical protein BO70DRAFT_359128 [Aspergillus heteromorphus CBS 117.55]|uniref:Uncharacterized protein n=1 Tax=Aspergillus heteromorphus CBS 117.55 TaxID=1448321 RepID=A0A317WZI5_9EURO|nr:uncharacterized protein BO70DRAFT_359128 [Aspergillus heteromorphus CBS 117.55]PWY90138.1 hypothetical protein BO70DRAFT_359128 [Aspergillus heteromorphus CBS 117.55]
MCPVSTLLLPFGHSMGLQLRAEFDPTEAPRKQKVTPRKKLLPEQKPGMIAYWIAGRQSDSRFAPPQEPNRET